MRRLLVATRLIVAVSILAAIVAQLAASVSYAGPNGRPKTWPVVVNFLSYFTIDSNTLSAIVLVVGAITLRRAGLVEPRGVTVARVAVTTYMIITGAVYNGLLRGHLVQGATIAWSNEILHVVAPAYLVLDWLIAPGRRPLSRRDALLTLAFPAVWVVYTLVRGPFATNPYLESPSWYPYPFIDPVTSTGGYASVLAYVVGIGLVTVLLALALAWTSRRDFSAGGVPRR